jgi:hypothetical protein
MQKRCVGNTANYHQKPSGSRVVADRLCNKLQSDLSITAKNSNLHLRKKAREQLRRILYLFADAFFLLRRLTDSRTRGYCVIFSRTAHPRAARCIRWYFKRTFFPVGRLNDRQPNIRYYIPKLYFAFVNPALQRWRRRRQQLGSSFLRQFLRTS